MLEFDDDLSSNPLLPVDDGWVLYHGTSESYSASIASAGLGHPDGTPPYWDDVQSFVSYWRDLALVGAGSHAFAALAGFSQSSDGKRAVSFGHTFERAARYAVMEPGGETLGTLRRSINEIARALENPAIPQRRLREARERLWERATSAGFEREAAWDALNTGTYGSSFASIDRALGRLNEPAELVAMLGDYRRRYADSPQDHEPVVYAVRIEKADLGCMFEDAAGLNYRGVLPPSRLVARVRVSRERQGPGVGAIDPSDVYLEAVSRWQERLSP